MTPRCGSSFLCDALQATGQAGRPEEYYTAETMAELFTRFSAGTLEEVHAKVLRLGTTPNGIFGAKVAMGGYGLERVIEVTTGVPIVPGVRVAGEDHPYDPDLFRAAFPNLQYVFITRRNKVRQAVSWWKAVQTDQWVLREGDAIAPNTGLNYVFEAIDQLVQEAVFREAGWQAFFETMGASPYTVVYEDLVASFEQEMRRLLDALGLYDVPVPSRERRIRRQADALSEEWVQRYRMEKQKTWKHIGW